MGKGASIYITEAELEALQNAQSYLSALLEAANEADLLIKTKEGLASIEHKVSKARNSAGKRLLITAALRAAQGN